LRVTKRTLIVYSFTVYIDLIYNHPRGWWFIYIFQVIVKTTHEF